jgi:hypothetical protein
METKDIIALSILFLVSFYLCTLPVKDNAFPFGENDAAHKYGLADWMYSADKAPRDMPYFYAMWYAWQNPKDFYNPPNAAPYFIDMVSTHLVGGGDRFTANNLFLAITSLLLASFSVYFLLRKLYTFWIAFLSGFILLFPLQGIMAYLWGLRPHLIGFAYVPLIIYCYYRYTDSFIKKEAKLVYLLFAAILTAVAGVIYMQTIILIGIFVLTYTFYLVVKERKIPLKLSHAGISLLIIALVLGPFIPDIINQHTLGQGGLKVQNLGNLFYWFKADPSLPNQFLYQYGNVNGGWWTLPFLLLGVFLLLFRRTKADIVLLFWLFAFYIAIHLDVIGVLDQGRVARLMYANSNIFYPIITVGFMGLLSFVKLSKEQKMIARYIFIAAFFVLVIVLNARPAYDALKDAYPPIARMTPYQYEAAQWLEQNIPDSSILYAKGSLTYAKMRWIHMFSHRAMTGWGETLEQSQKSVSSFPVTNHITHILLDYSDYTLIGNKQEIDQLKEFEQIVAKNATLLYDKDYIKVYQIAKP